MVENLEKPDLMCVKRPYIPLLILMLVCSIWVLGGGASWVVKRNHATRAPQLGETQYPIYKRCMRNPVPGSRNSMLN